MTFSQISTIQTALRAKPNLKLSILTDALRGTREAPSLSCASLLAPLVTEFGPERVDIRMYHTPNLTGLRKKYIPLRINEGWGLQHMKLYGVDDEIIISGANLSTDYFTNRQDRYHLFSSKEITQYFFGIHQAVAGLSFVVAPSAQLPAGFSLEWPSSNSAPSPLVDHTKYMAASKAILSPLIAPKALANTLPENCKPHSKTFLAPHLINLSQKHPRLPHLPTNPSPLILHRAPPCHKPSHNPHPPRILHFLLDLHRRLLQPIPAPHPPPSLHHLLQ